MTQCQILFCACCLLLVACGLARNGEKIPEVRARVHGMCIHVLLAYITPGTVPNSPSGLQIPAGHIVPKLPFRLLHRHLLMCQHFKHNIYMGNYLTITRGNDIKTNQLMKG